MKINNTKNKNKNNTMYCTAFDAVAELKLIGRRRKSGETPKKEEGSPKISRNRNKGPRAHQTIPKHWQLRKKTTATLKQKK